jgi:hypothetical protein
VCSLNLHTADASVSVTVVVATYRPGAWHANTVGQLTQLHEIKSGSSALRPSLCSHLISCSSDCTAQPVLTAHTIARVYSTFTSLHVHAYTGVIAYAAVPQLGGRSLSRVL